MKAFLIVLALIAIAPSVRATDAVSAGQLVIEPATLICLGFEWDITGDDNRNATVDVSYRASGQTTWMTGMPLLRMGGEQIIRAPYTVPNRFAGSILEVITADDLMSAGQYPRTMRLSRRIHALE